MVKNRFIFIIVALVLAAIIAGGAWVYLQQSGFFEPPTRAEYLQSQREAYLALGISSASLDKIINQILTLEDQLAAAPDDYQSLNQIGVLYQRLHEYDLAKEKFEQALTVFPDEALAHGNLAELDVFVYKNFESAAEHYKKAIASDYYNVGYYRSLGDLYRSEFPDRIGEIEPLFIEGVKKSPHLLEDFYSYLIDFFWSQGDIDKAIFYTQAILDNAPKDRQKYQQILTQLQADKNK